MQRVRLNVWIETGWPTSSGGKFVVGRIEIVDGYVYKIYEGCGKSAYWINLETCADLGAGNAQHTIRNHERRFKRGRRTEGYTSAFWTKFVDHVLFISPFLVLEVKYFQDCKECAEKHLIILYCTNHVELEAVKLLGRDFQMMRVKSRRSVRLASLFCYE